MPIISNVPKDHHSLLQLYLDGPKDKIFYIFSLAEKNKDKIKTVKIKNNSTDILNDKSLNEIKVAQQNALIKSLKKIKFLLESLKLRKMKRKFLVNYLHILALETVLVGKLVSINPFDQPAVEQVKIFTKDFLI